MENPTIVFPEPETVVVDDRERPEPVDDEVLVETTHSLVSTGTELTVLSGAFPDDSAWADYGQYPFVAGYSAVGEVVAVGDAVDVGGGRGGGVGLETGATVAVDAPHQRFVTAKADELVVVPDGVTAEEATFFSLAAITMNGVRRGEVTWGESVAVFGLGLLGQLTTRWCRLAGARPVVAFDVEPARLAFLPDDRAEIVAANPAAVDPTAVVAEHANGRLADVVFEVTGVPDAIPDQFDVLREQGRFVVLSSPRGRTALDLHDHCNAPGYRIVGAHDRTHPPVSTPRDPWSKARHYELFFDLLGRREVSVEPLVTHRIPFRDAPDVYEQLLDDRSKAMGVVIEW